MTRISAGVRGIELCDKHLNKERIEILRIPNAIKKKVEQGKKIDLSKQPERFKLGAGHVVFFYDKLKYIHERYNELTQEAIKRGFNPTDYSSAFKGLPETLYKGWEETPEARKETVARICERLEAMKAKDIKYISKSIDRNHLITNLKAS